MYAKNFFSQSYYHGSYWPPGLGLFGGGPACDEDVCDEDESIVKARKDEQFQDTIMAAVARTVRLLNLDADEEEAIILLATAVIELEI
jgi:hypothetical protein